MKLKSKQEEVFEVEKEVACRSVTVKNMVDDTGLDAPVPLPMVDSKILIKVPPPGAVMRRSIAAARERAHGTHPPLVTAIHCSSQQHADAFSD